MPAAGFSSPTNVDVHKCRHNHMSPQLSGYINPQSHKFIAEKLHLWQLKVIQILKIKGKTIIELIQGFTECGMTRCTWTGSTFIVDQNIWVDSILSNAHRSNGVIKVLGILLLEFVARRSERSQWRHHGQENKQLTSAQCQCKVSTFSGGHICKVWHSTGISRKYRNIGIDFSGITARYKIPRQILNRLRRPPVHYRMFHMCHQMQQKYFYTDKFLQWITKVYISKWL